MTFDEYNTDENFDNDKSSLEELVKKGKEEGKSKDEIRKALSPKWQKSSKINKFDEYYGEDLPKKKEPSADDAVGIKALKSINAVPEAPKSNPPEKPAEEKTAPKVEEMTQTTEALEQPKTEPEEEKTPYTSPLESEETGIKQSDKKYMNEVNAILNEQQKEELKKLSKTSLDAYNRTMSNMERSGDAFKKIDDKLIEQLPTFMFKRYQNGEFGAPESSDAKLRLAYFAINNVVSKFKQIANADAISRGKGAIFENTESAYDKYQKTNLEQGLENRWSKYKQETQAAVDMVKNRNVSEEEALNIVNKISMNNRLQNAFNMADENKKAYMIEVLSKVGDKVSNWNDQKFINALIGAEITGENVDNAVALIGARAGGKALDQLGLFDENGNLDISVLKQYINLPGFTDKFKAQFGFDPTKLLEGGASSEGGESPTGATLEDGTNIDAGKIMTNADYDKIAKAAEDLGNKYYNGEIDEEKFRREYGKLEAEMKKHGIYNKAKNIKSADAYIKQIHSNKLIDLDKQLDAFNTQAQSGDLSTSDYNEKFEELKKEAIKYGATRDLLKSLDKKKLSSEAILKSVEKNNKKKNKKK
jgi:hypothetical protein